VSSRQSVSLCSIHPFNKHRSRVGHTVLHMLHCLAMASSMGLTNREPRQQHQYSFTSESSTALTVVLPVSGVAAVQGRNLDRPISGPCCIRSCTLRFNELLPAVCGCVDVSVTWSTAAATHCCKPARRTVVLFCLRLILPTTLLLPLVTLVCAHTLLYVVPLTLIQQTLSRTRH
jgi:hypothetical protein